MTKLIAIIAALLQIVPATRTISGEVYRIDYPTDTQDAPIVTIVTEDGHEWITAPSHSPARLMHPQQDILHKFSLLSCIFFYITTH